jgi:hypothetical protein
MGCLEHRCHSSMMCFTSQKRSVLLILTCTEHIPGMPRECNTTRLPPRSSSNQCSGVCFWHPTALVSLSPSCNAICESINLFFK